MSIATTPDTLPEAAPAGRPPRTFEVKPVTQIRVIRSEWIKLWSLRSTWFTLAASVIGVVGLGLLVSYESRLHFNDMRPIEQLTFDPVARSLAGYHLAQLAIGVLGVLVISGEYATGMIRATLAATPKRLPVLWAKIAVFGSVVFVLMLASSFIAFLGGQHLLHPHNTTLSAPHVLRSVVGIALYLTVVAILSIGIGFIVRTTAGGIATVFGLLLVLPVIMFALPQSWQDTLSPYLPGNAGADLFDLHPDSTALAPWTGFGVAVIGGANMLRRRDA
jgi:ABC-type transport system involved in multi-copper enzyme maturation permease subunit